MDKEMRSIELMDNSLLMTQVVHRGDHLDIVAYYTGGYAIVKSTRVIANYIMTLSAALDLRDMLDAPKWAEVWVQVEQGNPEGNAVTTINQRRALRKIIKQWSIRWPHDSVIVRRADGVLLTYRNGKYHRT